MCESSNQHTVYMSKWWKNCSNLYTQTISTFTETDRNGIRKPRKVCILDLNIFGIYPLVVTDIILKLSFFFLKVPILLLKVAIVSLNIFNGLLKVSILLLKVPILSLNIFKVLFQVLILPLEVSVILLKIKTKKKHYIIALMIQCIWT